MTTATGLRAVKMSGAGNDFLVLGPDAIDGLPDDVASWVRRVCRRGLSIGADGVLLVRPTGPGRVQVSFHNPDGSHAFCGNGSRCAARFAHREGLADNAMVLETCGGEVPAEVDGDRVRLRLPPPQDGGSMQLEIEGATLEGRRVDAGAPHFVTFVEDPRSAPLELWGPRVRGHARFAPEGINFDLARLDGDRVTLRTWEKGVERETLACGSGAVAAAAAARLRGAAERVIVLPASGVPLEVAIEAKGASLCGDARVIFEGRLDPEATRGF